MIPIVNLVKIDAPLDRDTVNYFMSFVPPEKKVRILRQRIKQNADTMLVGSVLEKCMIAQYFHIPFDQQQILYSEYGKPYLRNFPDVHFNISHSGPYVVCAVCDSPVGVDVQIITEYKPEIASRVCSRSEINSIEADKMPDNAFTRLWTRKEAYLKMLGTGLGDGMRLDLSRTDIKTFDLGGSFLSLAAFR